MSSDNEETEIPEEADKAPANNHSFSMGVKLHSKRVKLKTTPETSENENYTRNE